MSDLAFLMVFFALAILTLAGYAIWDITDRIYQFFAAMCVVDVMIILWFALYIFTPYRIETNYEVRPEYNQNKTVQFITLKEPNKHYGDQIVTTYPLFNRLLSDNETVTVHQKYIGTYWGIYPEPQTINDRNIFEVK